MLKTITKYLVVRKNQLFIIPLLVLYINITLHAQENPFLKMPFDTENIHQRIEIYGVNQEVNWQRLTLASLKWWNEHTNNLKPYEFYIQSSFRWEVIQLQSNRYWIRPRGLQIGHQFIHEQEKQPVSRIHMTQAISEQRLLEFRIGTSDLRAVLQSREDPLLRYLRKWNLTIGILTDSQFTSSAHVRVNPQYCTKKTCFHLYWIPRFSTPEESSLLKTMTENQNFIGFLVDMKSF